MKYEVRKVEKVAIFLASPVIKLDTKAFKELEDNPYTGNSEEAFAKYLASLALYDLPWDLDDDTKEVLESLSEAEMTQISSSAEHGENAWLEIGRTDPAYRKNGGFDTLATTQDSSY